MSTEPQASVIVHECHERLHRIVRPEACFPFPIHASEYKGGVFLVAGHLILLKILVCCR